MSENLNNKRLYNKGKIYVFSLFVIYKYSICDIIGIEEVIMKKHSFFKVMLIILGLIIVASYFIPGREEAISYLAIGDVGLNFVQAFYYFFDTIVYLLVLGAFYGILNSVPAYKKLLDNIAQKVKVHSKLFVFITTGLFAVLTSIIGLTNVLLIFVPFVISIILLLGYDKLVAVSSTVVAMLVGFMSSLFATFRDPNNYYGYSATTVDKMVGLELYGNVWPKLVLLVLGTALLIFFISRHIKNVQEKKVKYELNDSDEVLVSEVKGDYKNLRTWPLLVIFGILFVLLVLGYVPWNSLFGIECFDKFHEWLIALKIGEYTVFPSLVSSNLVAFGNWASLGNYMIIILLLIVFGFIIKLVYRVKFDDVIDGFVSGSKKMMSIVFLVALTYAILVCTYNNGFVSTIISYLAESKLGLNVVTTSLVTALGSVLHADLYYTAAGVFSPILSAVTDDTLYATYAMTFQSIYGLISIIGPTSFLLIVVLTYFDIPYTTWVKYIWRFVLMLLLLVILILLVLALI